MEFHFFSFRTVLCCASAPLKNILNGSDIAKAALTIEKGKTWPSVASTWLSLTVACGSCLPSWFASLPPSPPASYHQFLTPPSSHTCVSTFFPSYSHISICPHLISSLFLQSRVHSCLLGSILQACFPSCHFVYSVMLSCYSLPNYYSIYVTGKKKGNHEGNTTLNLLICDSIPGLVRVRKQLRLWLMQSLQK